MAGCRDPVVPPPPDANLVVTVEAEPHDWAHYSCTVSVSLASSTSIIAADSATVDAGSSAALTIVARRATYTAHIALRWVGRPASWDLTGTWYDTLTVHLPDSTHVGCP